MNNFIKRIILFLLPIIGVLCFAEYTLRSIPNDYTNKARNLSLYGDSIETLYLGNSHILFGINPDITKSWDFNLASTSQSIDLDLMLLEKFKSKLPNLKCVVIPLDYFTLRTSLNIGIEKWRIKNYVIYYGLHKWFNPNYYFELLNGLPSKNIIRIARYLKHNITDINSTNLGWGTKYKLTTQPNLAKSAKDAATRHTFTKTNIIATNEYVLELLVKSAEKHKLKVLFITSPATSQYIKNLNSTQLLEVLRKGQALETKNPKNVKYYNLINCNLFRDDDFYDGDHLNQKGALKYSYYLDSLVKITTKNHQIR